MRSFRDSEFVRTLPESIAYILNEFLIYIGIFVALIGAVYFNSWWAFPIIFLVFIAVGYGLAQLLRNKKRDEGN